VTAIRAEARLDAPHLDPGDALQAVLAAALARRAFPAGPDRLAPWELWAPSHFGLDRVTRFEQADEAARRQVLAACARGLLEEAYFIEKAGLAFAAKMVLLAESADERVLYSLVAADEATHLHAVASHLRGPDRPRAASPFVRWLAEEIQEGDGAGLGYLIPVVLEGWGIVHYQALARGCRGARLRATLVAIARDEALHHRGGVLLAGRRAATDASRERLVEALARLLDMVRAGPQAVVAALDGATGPLGRAELVRTFRELDAEAHSGRRLGLLRALAHAGGADRLIERLDRRGLFAPLDPEACADRFGRTEGGQTTC
jgi:hypothetical protein